jgi:hypothetical protein
MSVTIKKLQLKLSNITVKEDKAKNTLNFFPHDSTEREELEALIYMMQEEKEYIKMQIVLEEMQ